MNAIFTLDHIFESRYCQTVLCKIKYLTGYLDFKALHRCIRNDGVIIYPHPAGG